MEPVTEQEWAEGMDSFLVELQPYFHGRPYKDLICMAIYVLTHISEQQPQLRSWIRSMVDSVMEPETLH